MRIESVDMIEFDFGYRPYRILPDLHQHPDLVELICAHIDDADECQIFRDMISSQTVVGEEWAPPLCFGEFVNLLIKYNPVFKKVVSDKPMLLITRSDGTEIPLTPQDLIIEAQFKGDFDIELEHYCFTFTDDHVLLCLSAQKSQLGTAFIFDAVQGVIVYSDCETICHLCSCVPYLDTFIVHEYTFGYASFYRDTLTTFSRNERSQWIKNSLVITDWQRIGTGPSGSILARTWEAYTIKDIKSKNLIETADNLEIIEENGVLWCFVETGKGRQHLVPLSKLIGERCL